MTDIKWNHAIFWDNDHRCWFMPARFFRNEIEAVNWAAAQRSLQGYRYTYKKLYGKPVALPEKGEGHD